MSTATGRFILAALLVSLVTISCTTGDSGEEASTTSEARRGSTEPVFRIIELRFAPDGVVLKNFSGVAAQLGGRWLCDPPECVELPEAIVEPSGVIAISIDSNQADADVSLHGPGPLHPASGELGLYTLPKTEDPSALEAYLEWGSTPHEGTASAVAAGRWFEGSFAPTDEDAARLFVNPDTGLWLWEER